MVQKILKMFGCLKVLIQIDILIQLIQKFLVIIIWSTTCLDIIGILAFLKFEFLYMLLLIVAITLSMTNALAFTKCDKFGKANNFANDIFSKATGSIFSRFNPFNR